MTLKEDFNYEKRSDFKELVEPVVLWLQKYRTPHDKIIIAMDGAELVSGEIGVSFEVVD